MTEKQAVLEGLYSRWVELQKQYQSHVALANQCYLRDDLSFLSDLGVVESVTVEVPPLPPVDQIRESTGRFFGGAIFYDERIPQTRNQERCIYIDGPAVIRNSIQEVSVDDVKMHVITAGVDLYLNNVIFVNYDEPSAAKFDSFAGRFSMLLSPIEEIRNEVETVYTEQELRHMSVDKILSHFANWRSEFPSE